MSYSIGVSKALDAGLKKIPLGYFFLYPTKKAGDDIKCYDANNLDNLEVAVPTCNAGSQCRGVSIDFDNSQVCLKNNMGNFSKYGNGILLDRIIDSKISSYTGDMIPPFTIPSNYNLYDVAGSKNGEMICPNYGTDWQKYTDLCDSSLGCNGVTYDKENDETCLTTSVFPLVKKSGYALVRNNVPRNKIDFPQQKKPAGYQYFNNTTLLGKNISCEDTDGNKTIDEIAQGCGSDCKAFVSYNIENGVRTCYKNDIVPTESQDGHYLFIKNGATATTTPATATTTPATTTPATATTTPATTTPATAATTTTPVAATTAPAPATDTGTFGYGSVFVIFMLFIVIIVVIIAAIKSKSKNKILKLRNIN